MKVSDKRNYELLDSHKDRELWVHEIQTPSGEWLKLFTGKEFLTLGDGTRKQTPNTLVSQSKEDVWAWIRTENSGT